MSKKIFIFIVLMIVTNNAFSQLSPEQKYHCKATGAFTGGGSYDECLIWVIKTSDSTPIFTSSIDSFSGHYARIEFFLEFDTNTISKDTLILSNIFCLTSILLIDIITEERFFLLFSDEQYLISSELYDYYSHIIFSQNIKMEIQKQIWNIIESWLFIPERLNNCDIRHVENFYIEAFFR